MPIFVLLGGAALIALYLYGQRASAAVDEANAVNTGEPFTENGGSGETITYPNTAGFRNHNPGNLIYLPTDAFNGQVGQAGKYGVYDTMANGVRALGKQLDDYVLRDNLNTVQLLITRWAPPAENNTAAYIAAVSKAAQRQPMQVLNWPQEKPDIAAAIIEHENGANPIPVGDLLNWLNI